MFQHIVQDPDFLKKLGALVVLFLFFRFVLLIAGLVQTARRKKFREQYERGFSASQRRDGFARAGNRCEFDNGMARCKNRAEHADHFYPWARGGATSMNNLVAACAGHNLSKGAKMPSPLLKSRIENRRKRYFPRGANRTAGEWSVRHKNQPESDGPGWSSAEL